MLPANESTEIYLQQPIQKFTFTPNSHLFSDNCL